MKAIVHGIIVTPDGERRVDLRVSTLPTMNRINREKIVLRVLEKGNAVMGLKNLGLDAESEQKVNEFCALPWGMVLATGPTGSGKSTTLYSMLRRINRPNVNIVTVEDPIEFSIAGINQVQVNEPAGVTFESALRSILRQDPDKIMVGEIRDQETAQIAIRAAMTGHLVLSTLHTNDAPSAAIRLINMGVPAFLVSAALSGVIAQRLVRRLDNNKEEYEPDESVKRYIRDVLEGVDLSDYDFDLNHIRLWREKPSDDSPFGFNGRTAIMEQLVVTEPIQKFIRGDVRDINTNAIEKTAREEGMLTLEQKGVLCALRGETTIDEVGRVI